LHPLIIVRESVCTNNIPFCVLILTRLNPYFYQGKYYLMKRNKISLNRRNFLEMAERCISGDFIAYASYRVTAHAVAMGEAAGPVAAIVSKSSRLLHLNSH
jgi:hypothetical protein